MTIALFKKTKTKALLWTAIMIIAFDNSILLMVQCYTTKAMRTTVHIMARVTNRLKKIMPEEKMRE